MEMMDLTVKTKSSNLTVVAGGGLGGAGKAGNDSSEGGKGACMVNLDITELLILWGLDECRHHIMVISGKCWVG